MEKRKKKYLRQKEKKEKAAEQSCLRWISEAEDVEDTWLYVGRRQWISWSLKYDYEEKPWIYAESTNQIRRKLDKVSQKYAQPKNINCMLPDEILLDIFGLLCFRDLGAAMLVCRRWRDVGETRGLWTRLGLTVYQDQWLQDCQHGNILISGNLNIMPMLLGVGRLRGLRKIKLHVISKELLQALQMVENHGIREMELNGVDLEGVESELFAKALGKMEEVLMYDTYVDDEMAKALFTEAICDSSNLQSITIHTQFGDDYELWNAGSIEPDLYAKLVLKLKVLAIPQIYLSYQQMMSIFSALNGESQLKKLDIRADSEINEMKSEIEHVEPFLLALTVLNLEELSLRDSYLTCPQIRNIFKAIPENPLFKKLDLSGNDLSSVEPEQLTKAVKGLEELALFNACLTNIQVRAIFLAFDETTKLKKLAMGCDHPYWNWNDFSVVEPELLARVVNKVEYVDLYKARLSEEQEIAIMTQSRVKTSPIRLRDGDYGINSDWSFKYEYEKYDYDDGSYEDVSSWKRTTELFYDFAMRLPELKDRFQRMQ